MTPTIKIEDLPVGDADVIDWLNAFIKANNVSQSDLPGLSVSVQLIIAELMEQLELLSTQISNTALPSVHDSFGEVSREVEAIESELNHLVMPGNLKVADLRNHLDTIADLNRARGNIELVKKRLSQ